MNVDLILETFNRSRVEYLLIGGMNFLLRHEPILTFDVDLWIEDTDINRSVCEAALGAIGAEWGPTDDEWKPVSELPPGWLSGQAMFCLYSPHGSIDIFRVVAGLPNWKVARSRAVLGQTAGGVSYFGLSDADMLECQMALEPGLQKADRIKVLRRSLGLLP